MGLSFHTNNSTAVLASVMSRVSNRVYLDSVTLFPYLGFGAQLDCVKHSRSNLFASFIGTDPVFQVKMQGIKRDAVVLQTGFTSDFKHWKHLSPEVYGDYRAELRFGNSHRQSLSLGGKIRW